MMGDALHALRALARAPLLTIVVVLSLGIGIGVNTVVFSWIQALTLRPLPGVRDASRFHLIEPITEAAVRPGASWLEYRDLAASLSSFDGLVAFRMVPLNVGVATRSERTTGLLISGNYFPALGLRPALGRFIRSDEVEAPGRSPVVVISYDYWHTRFGAAGDVVGRTIRVNDVDLTIVGVTPERFQGTVLGLQFDLWVPATMAPVLLNGSRELEERRARGYYVMGALRTGVSLAEAQSNADAGMRRLAEQFPETNATLTAQVLPFWRAGRGPQGMLLQGLAVLQGVLLVLLVAVCGNTANLMLARASARVREIGVRLAVGAGAWRIVRLLLVESLLLGAAAAIVGSLIAVWGTNALRAVPVLTTQFPVRFQTDLDAQTLLFAIALGLVGALLFGVAPAIQLARVSPQFVLRAGSGLTTRSRLGAVLMAVEVALAAIVLVVAGLFFRSFQQTQATDPGFQVNGVLMASYDLTGRNADRDQARQFADRVLRQLRALGDVESAALAVSVPLDIHGLPSRTFQLEGRARTDGSLDRSLSNTVTPGYFATMGILFIEGVDFVELSDTTAPPQAIVNDAFVRRYVGSGETLGRQVTIGGVAHVIIGVVRTSLNDSFAEPPTPVVYLSYRDRPSTFAEMHVRTRLGDEMLLVPSLRRALGAVDASLPLFNARTLRQHVDMNLVLRRIPAQMFLVLGPLMLVLAAMGIYSVVAYNVAHRTSEIGVRMALGAHAGRVLRQIIGENMRVVFGGAVAGWGMVAYIYTRFMRGELDIMAFFVVPVLLLLVAATACWVPARRASRIDPVVALRAE
jgi:predicted permease